MTTPDTALVEGTFEYIEAKIRRDASGTAFGGDFEWLCKWFLENAPRYRGQFDKVWLWNDWPDRWGTDAGIDIVALTRTGELWAIQAKADHPNRSIPKREIDSFLSESNRPQFAYRLLMATTDSIGKTARRTLHGQEKPVGLILRGHFLTEEVQWPVQIGETVARLPQWNARPHQVTAIDAVVHGFRAVDRGQLIMACGTGKTLTALWIAERLQSSLTLVLVPSLSLVQQNLAEWGRHSARDFDTLVVCSDESISQIKADTAIQSTADLGVKVTTDPAEIGRFLGQRRKRSAVVFGTYHSSDRIATAQAGKRKRFDLVICDEAHRLAGNAEGLFATVLDGKKIKARKRLFMTATPRYIKHHVKRRAAEQEFELLSMDDEHVFGPEFHVLSFHEAISTERPLLTDYQVVVIGVTDREAKAWAERATLVRTTDGLNTDARTLAAQIGLAKAMKKYDLRKLISFHSSVAKAKRFVDDTLRDSLPGVIPHLTRSARPTGKLWTKHISGHTPAGQRATLLNGLGNLSKNTRGILSNCACLGEGVDVPVLDGVAFIDPKRSMVDIIQAVGRVLRKAEGKQIGTIVIPIFIDEFEDADQVLSQSAFEPVWQVLKALRAHDRRLADELDQLRLSLGQRSKSGGLISLPKNIRLDVPRLLLNDFEQAFYVTTVRRTTTRQFRGFEEAREFARTLRLNSYDEWRRYRKNELPGADSKPDDIPSSPQQVYAGKGWVSWGDWLGTGNPTPQRQFRPFKTARSFVHNLGLKSAKDWRRYVNNEIPGMNAKPADIPSLPYQAYKHNGWINWGDWLGTGTPTPQRQFRPFEKARSFARKLGLKSYDQWTCYCKNELPGVEAKPDDIPSTPNQVYKRKGWISWGDWLGTGKLAAKDRKYRDFDKARSFVRSLRLKNKIEWMRFLQNELPGSPCKPDDIPGSPDRVYDGKGWVNWYDWLGKQHRQYRPFEEARDFVQELGLKSAVEWRPYVKNELPGADPKPDDIPGSPHQVYKDQGWISWSDWLGNQFRQYRTFEEAREFVRKLGLKSGTEWRRYVKNELTETDIKPDDIPSRPSHVYKGQGWISWGDWLGTGSIAVKDRQYREFEPARRFARKLNLRTSAEWNEYCRKGMNGKPKKPIDIPNAPASHYKDKGWIDWGDWLGTGFVPLRFRVYRVFAESRTFVRRLNLKSKDEWVAYCKGEMRELPSKPHDIPNRPSHVYRTTGWSGWGDWLKSGKQSPRGQRFRDFNKAREFVRSLELRSHTEWLKYCRGEFPDKVDKPPDIPADPRYVYQQSGWTSWRDWLTDQVAARK